MNIKGQETVKIKHVQGNFLSLAISLHERVRSIKNGDQSVENADYAPGADDEVHVHLRSESGWLVCKYQPEISGNVVTFSDNGLLQCGVYGIEIVVLEHTGQKRRFYGKSYIEVVNSTAEAGADPGVEYDGITHELDADVFSMMRGYSAYEVWLKAGHEGTEEDFLNWLAARVAQPDWDEEDAESPAYIHNKPEIPEVPTNVSAFTNDAGYLTQHQDLSGKQDVIDDLDEVRTGAQLGSTAYQKPISGIPSTDLARAVQDALEVAGTALQPSGLMTLNNKVADLESLISKDYISVKSMQNALDVLGRQMFGTFALSYNEETAQHEVTFQTKVPQFDANASSGYPSIKDGEVTLGGPTAYRTSDFIAVTGGDIIDVKPIAGQIVPLVFYDKEFNYVSHLPYSSTLKLKIRQNIEVPSNAAYFRFSWYSAKAYGYVYSHNLQRNLGELNRNNIL